MKEDPVERLFVASLRSALEDIAPERLDVFENWFPPGDRRPRFHIAPVMGAVSYLSRDPELYKTAMEKAGRIASVCWLASMLWMIASPNWEHRSRVAPFIKR